MPPKVKKILKGLGIFGAAGAVGGMAASPGAIHISGSLAAKFGAAVGLLIPLLGYVGIKCHRHLWNFIKCAGRAFMFHNDPAGKTIQTWTKGASSNV